MRTSKLATLSLSFLTATSLCLMTAPAIARLQSSRDSYHYNHQQQRQLNQQARTIRRLEGRVDTLESRNKRVTYSHNPGPKHPEIVNSANQAFHVMLHGQINQIGTLSHDGNNDDVFFGNNNTSTSRVKVTATANVNPDTTIIGRTEIGLKNQSSDMFSQTSDGGRSLDVRKVEVVFSSVNWGALTLGRGDTASNTTAENDLSGTEKALCSNVQDLGGGLFFRNSVTGVLSAITVGSVMNGLDGLSRQGRVRYDTPTFWGGFSVATSAIRMNSNNYGDVSLWFKRTFPWVKVNSAIAFASTNGIAASATGVLGHAYDGSISVLFNNGINFTYAGGMIRSSTTGRNDPRYNFYKAGYIAHIFSSGTTRFAGEYGRFHEYAANADKAQDYGVVVFQDIKNWNTGVYVGWRHYTLTRTGTSFHPLNLGFLGAIVVF